MSLAFPWEVIERVIDHSSGSMDTLYSFTLSCHQLNPRSTMLLFGRIVLKNRDQLFSLCNVLRAKPYLQPAVRSIIIPPHEFSPHPLLRMLHNLSEIEFTTAHTSLMFPRAVTIHTCVLQSCRQFGDHIRSLSLERIFPSLHVFSAILLSFRRLRSLSCSQIGVPGDGINQGIISRRISEHLLLETLNIGVVSFTWANVLVLLGQVANHTTTKLVLRNPDLSESLSSLRGLRGPSPSSSWARLTSLTLRIDVDNATLAIQQILGTFGHFCPPNLREVTVDFNVPSVSGLLQFLHFCARSERFRELEEILLGFPQLEVRFSLHRPVNVRKCLSWKGQIEKTLPTFTKRDVLTFKAESSGRLGHDSRIRTRIVMSADSRWAATGSEDDAVIIWDLRNGSISHEWSVRPPDYYDPAFVLQFLAFSPDGQYVASTGPWCKMTVWDLNQDACVFASLGYDKSVRRRVWSPDGCLIVGFDGGSTQVWEATAFKFRQLHPEETWYGDPLALSPDGRWLVTGVLDKCRLWSLASGQLQWAQCHDGWINSTAFDPESARLVTGKSFGDGTSRIWAVETGQKLFVLREPRGPGWSSSGERHASEVAYSPDGTLVLSWPSSASGGVARIWEASSGILRARLDTPDRAALSACFSPCSRYVASASEKGFALLWRTSDGACIAKVSENGSQVDHVAISPDGEVLCCGATDGTVVCRRLRSLVPADE